MKMPSLSDLQKTKEELELALAELDNLERATRNIELTAENGAAAKNETERSREDSQLKEKIEFLEQANRELAVKNEELVEKFKTVNSEKDSLKNDIDSLRDISNKLQNDVGKVNEEKSLLSSIVRNTQDENKVLSKVMEKISIDYEELKKAFESQKCPKDDKIKALRNTARALETENELLLEEKKMISRDNIAARAALEQKVVMIEKDSQIQKQQLAAYAEEKKLLLDRFERLESEKLNIMQQLSRVERELDTAKSQVNKVNQGEVITLCVLFLFTILIVCFYH